MMQQSEKIKIADLSSLLTCVLCGGYYIDATTIIECLHSFCKTCIVRYLQTNKYCPICDVQVHKTRPLLNIRSDRALQDIVYKLVPDLFKNEMKRRRDFYLQQSELGVKDPVATSSEDRGDVLGCGRLIFSPEDIFSVSLEYCPPHLSFPLQMRVENRNSLNTVTDSLPNSVTHRRYLQCRAAVSVYHLKKLLRAKYSLQPYQKIDILYVHDQLKDDLKLLDLAYIYSWKNNGPLKLFYKIYETPRKKLKKETSVFYKETQPVSASDDKSLPVSVETPAHSAKTALDFATSVAAAPSSHSHIRYLPSGPPSPQMAPESIKLDKPNCAVTANGPQCTKNSEQFVPETERNSGSNSVSEHNTKSKKVLENDNYYLIDKVNCKSCNGEGDNNFKETEHVNISFTNGVINSSRKHSKNSFSRNKYFVECVKNSHDSKAEVKSLSLFAREKNHTSLVQNPLTKNILNSSEKVLKNSLMRTKLKSGRANGLKNHNTKHLVSRKSC